MFLNAIERLHADCLAMVETIESVRIANYLHPDVGAVEEAAADADQEWDLASNIDKVIKVAQQRRGHEAVQILATL